MKIRKKNILNIMHDVYQFNFWVITTLACYYDFMCQTRAMTYRRGFESCQIERDFLCVRSLYINIINNKLLKKNCCYQNRQRHHKSLVQIKGQNQHVCFGTLTNSIIIDTYLALVIGDVVQGLQPFQGVLQCAPAAVGWFHAQTFTAARLAFLVLNIIQIMLNVKKTEQNML